MPGVFDIRVSKRLNIFSLMKNELKYPTRQMVIITIRKPRP
jgi:hypothetical protein